MARGWLGLLLALAAAPLAWLAGEAPGTEPPTSRLQDPCLPDESPADPQQQRPGPRLSPCMLRCAAQAMRQMAGTRTTASLKLNEGTEGEEHEFCWMLRLRCQKGERLTKAFVLLNLEQPPDGGRPPPYRLLLTAPPSLQQYLRVRPGNRGTRVLNDAACGVRVDVTEPFRKAEGGPEAEMCLRAVCPEEEACQALQLGLRCPPFLATLWRGLPRDQGLGPQTGLP